MTKPPQGGQPPQGEQPSQGEQPPQGERPAKSSGPPRRRFWLKAGLTTAAIAVLGGAVGAWWGWVFVHNRLSPLVARQLSEVLNRPVSLGEVERVTLGSIRVGPSAIAATDDDPDEVFIDAIDVRFNLLRSLLIRELVLNFEARDVSGYFEQNAEGDWVDLELDLPDRDLDEDPFFEIKVGTIDFQGGELVLVPFNVGSELDAVSPEVPDSDLDADPDADLGAGPDSDPDAGLDSDSDAGPDTVDSEQDTDTEVLRESLSESNPLTPVTIGNLQGQVNLSDVNLENALDDDVEVDVEQTETQQIDFDITGEPGRGGDLAVQGAIVTIPKPEDAPETESAKVQANVAVRSQAVQFQDISPLVFSFFPAVPVDVIDGALDGNVEIAVRPEQPITLQGTADVNGGAVAIDRLPQPITDISGQLRFRETTIAMDDVEARYGDIEAQGGGSLDYTDGYDLAATVESFSLEQLANTFDFELPIPSEGLFSATVDMQGRLARPEITGTLEALGNTVIDRVTLADLNLDFSFVDSRLVFDRFSLFPQAGGSLIGQGTFSLGESPSLFLQAEGRDLPANAIGRAYGLPETITLGNVAVDAEVSGPLNNLRGLVNWQAPQGDYPARGEIALSGQQIDFRNTVVQVAGGLVRGEGTLVNGLWNARLNAEGIQLGEFVDRLQGSTGQAAAALSGSLDDLSLRGIRGDGTLSAQVAGGTVSGTATLANGNWLTDLQTAGILLSAFNPQLQGRASGDVQLSGSLSDLSLAGIRGSGNIALSQGLASFAGFSPQLERVNSPLTAAIAWDGRQVQVQQATSAGFSANGVLVPRLEGPGAPTLANLDLNLILRDYDLAALPGPPDGLMLAGRADFTGRLRGSLSNLALNGDAALTNLALNDLTFEERLSGPVTFAAGDRLAVDLTGDRDRLQVSYGFGTNNIAFDVRTAAQTAQGETLDAIATGTTEGNILQARLQNFPLAALNFPADGIAGYGQVRGVVDQADIAVDISDLSRPEFMGDLALSNPGVGYLGVDNFRGRITYANGTATLVGGNIEQTNSQGQISRYLLTGRYTQGPDPEIAGELEVVQGNLQDVLETAQIFRLTDFGRGLNPPEWIENDLSPEAIEAALATEPTGDPNATLLDQIRRLSEILVSQRIEQEQAEAEPLPPLGDLNGAFTGNVRFNGRLRSGLTAAFDFDGQNWQWGDEFAAERVVARGGYTDGVLNVERIELASGDRQNPMAITAIGDIALLAEDETPRTLQVSVVDVPIAPLQDVARIPVDISGRLNGTAQLTGSLQAPQVRGRLDIDQATVNQREVRSATARFSYNQARLNLISDLLVSDVDQPLALRASLPYVFPFMTVRPESNEYEIRMDVENEGLALINIFTDQIAWQGGDAALNLDITGEWQEAARRPRTINVQGSARFSDAEFALKTLPENLTDVDGVISFRRDRLVVQDLEGRYSEGRVEARGTFPLDPTVRLQTVEPPTATAPAERGAIADVAEANAAAAASRETVSLLDNVNPNGPLFVSLDRVDLELEDLYAGQVNGLVQVTGSAFPGPVLSGELFFTNGQVFLNSGDNSDGATAATGNTATPLPIVIGLSDLDLNLTRNIQVIQPGLFTLGAQGVLRLNGLLNDLEPSGRIDLTSGRVSLLATSLRLDGRDNYAEFEPETGLDPLLNLSLRTIVPEARTSGAGLVNSSPFPRNEVVDQDFEVFSLNQGSVRTVRIFAQVTGYASELTSLEGITFSSSPARSDSEILTLLSGPYIAALESTVGSTGGSGDSFQGLLTLAGSALLTQVQDIIGDALQLSEFSLFPTSPPSGQANDSDFDIGAEIGFNISNSFSASILQILTSSTAPQFNLRYRLSDQFTVRGTTTYEDFRERSGVILEYESRF